MFLKFQNSGNSQFQVSALLGGPIARPYWRGLRGILKFGNFEISTLPNPQCKASRNSKISKLPKAQTIKFPQKIKTSKFQNFKIQASKPSDDNMGVHKPGFAARLLLQAEPRIMYPPCLGAARAIGTTFLHGRGKCNNSCTTPTP